MERDHGQIWVYLPEDANEPESKPVGEDQRDYDLSSYSSGADDWWHGEMGCASGDCPVWSGVVQLRSGRLRYPLVCPYCHEQAAYPSDVWRETSIDCSSCDLVGHIAVLDPGAEMPTSVDCPECGSRVGCSASAGAMTH